MATIDQRIKISNPPDLSNLNFSRVVDRIAHQIKIHFTRANCKDADLSTFGMSLLNIENPGDKHNQKNVQLTDIVMSEIDIKEKFKQLLNGWVTKRRDPKWENVIAALRCIGLHNLADELADELAGELKPHQSQNGFEVEEPATTQDETKDKKPVINLEELKRQYDEIEPFISKGESDLKEMQLQVLIQTVNPKEFYAVMTLLNKKDGVSKYTVNHPNSKGKSSLYFVGKWSNNIPVVIVQTDMGSGGVHGSQNETIVAFHWLPNLRYIFTVGVCGGIKGKVNLGDVVVSQTIQDYSDTKDENNKLIIRSLSWDCKSGNFYNSISRAANLPVNAICGWVLSANTLLKNDNTQKKLLQACPNAIAFEMEAHGIAEACRDRGIEVLIVKGVSDFGDGNKNDNWQPQAALNAAKALCEAMGKCDLFDRTEQSSSATASTDTTEVNGEERATKVIEEIQKGEDSKTMSKGLDNQGND